MAAELRQAAAQGSKGRPDRPPTAVAAALASVPIHDQTIGAAHVLAYDPVSDFRQAAAQGANNRPEGPPTTVAAALAPAPAQKQTIEAVPWPF